MSLPKEHVAAMYADYQRGMSLAALGRRYGKDRRSIAEVFSRRGYPLRPGTNPNAVRAGKGQFAPFTPLSPAEIDVLVDQAKKVRVPEPLKLEWRHWTMKRRGKFIARLRAKLNLPTERPGAPFSANVEPFDYTTPRAWELVAKMNAGRNSRDARIKLDISSQGVIWKERLWFWSHKVGYQSGPWTPQGGRPALHRVIWEDYHGHPLPKSCVVRFADGNPNNFEPENLQLQTRDDICRQNQAAALTRRSRELTSVLLNSNQGKENGHALTIAALRQ